MEAAIKILLQAGYVLHGHTESDSYTSVTASSYPLAGRIVTTGGRQRLALPGTSKRASVGPRVVCLYEVVDGKAGNFRNFPTKEFKAEDLQA